MLLLFTLPRPIIICLYPLGGEAKGRAYGQSEKRGPCEQGISIPHLAQLSFKSLSVGSSEGMDRKGLLALQSNLESSWRWRWYRTYGVGVGEGGGHPACLQWGLHRIKDPCCHPATLGCRRWEVAPWSEHKQELQKRPTLTAQAHRIAVTHHR